MKNFLRLYTKLKLCLIPVLCYTYDETVEEVITPSHLMFGRRLLSVFHDNTEPNNVEFSSSSITKRAKHINKLLEQFWISWTREYLTGLREFHNCNGKVPVRQVKVGEVVLIETEKIPRNRWKMGVVEILYVGKDKYVRGCKVRTLKTKSCQIAYLNRPVNKLYPLEISCTKEDLNDTKKISDNDECTTTKIQNDELERPKRSAATRGNLKRILEKQK